MSEELNIVKIKFNATTKNEIKAQKKAFAAAYNSNILKDDEHYNAYVMKLNKKLFIVDCDDKAALSFVNSLIEECKIEPVFTKSISNKMKLEKYKYHYYFKNNLNIENNKTGINGGKLDLLVNSLLFEDAEEFNNIDLNDLPELTDEIYEKLLLFNGKIKKPTQIEEDIKLDFPNVQFENKEEEEININDFNNIDKVRALLDLLNDEHFYNRDSWIAIGQILHGINKDWEDLFNDVSKRGGEKYKGIKDVIYNWGTFNKTNIDESKKLTIGTLICWAKVDNPDGYKAFIDKFNKVFDYDDIFINYFNHSNIADFFYNKNRNNYIYCKIKKEELFLYYNEHNILKDNAEIIITNEIKKQIEKELKTVLNNIKEQLNNIKEHCLHKAVH